MNPDDLERILVGAECVGRFFHDLEFCILDFEFLNGPLLYEFQLRHVSDEDFWMKACVALSAEEVTPIEGCYGGNYYEVPRGSVGFL